MKSHPSFSIPATKRLKERGMEAAAKARKDALAKAQQVAIFIGRRAAPEPVSMDDVAWYMVKHYPHELAMLGNAAGNTFSGNNWRTYGEFVPSKRVSRHGAAIRLWYYERDPLSE